MAQLTTKISLVCKNINDWDGEYVPRLGQVCVVNIPDGATVEGIVETPAVLFKIGDGTHKFSELNFTYAKAVDVYAWAKKENLEFADLTDEFKDAIAEVVDGKVQYRLFEEDTEKWVLQKSVDGGETWVDVSDEVVDITSKVDIQVDGETTTTEVINEGDIAGVKISGTESTNADSYASVAVQKDTSGNWVQLDVINSDGSRARVCINGTGAYYVKGDSAVQTSDELATVGDLHSYTIRKKDESTQYAAVYNLIDESGEIVGDSINIPKDYLVKSAEVKVVTEQGIPYPEAKVGDKYIDFVLNTKDGAGEEQHLYLPVNSLVDVYTAGDGIQISDHNVVAVSDEIHKKVLETSAVESFLDYRGLVTFEEGTTEDQVPTLLKSQFPDAQVGTTASVSIKPNPDVIQNYIGKMNEDETEVTWVKNTSHTVFELRSEAEAEHENLQSQIDDIGGSTVEIEEEIDELRTDISTLDTKVDETKAELQGNIDAVDTKVDTVDGKVTTLDSKVDANKTELEGKIADTKTELEGEIDTAKTELQEEIATTKTTLEGEIESAVTDAKAYIDEELAEAKITLEGEISTAVEDAKEELTTAINTVKTDLTTEINKRQVASITVDEATGTLIITTIQDE